MHLSIRCLLGPTRKYENSINRDQVGDSVTVPNGRDICRSITAFLIDIPSKKRTLRHLLFPNYPKGRGDNKLGPLNKKRKCKI